MPPPFERPEEDDYLDYIESLPPCPTCDGTGETIGADGEDHTCGTCDGSGVEENFGEE